MVYERLRLTIIQYCGEFDNWGAVMSVSQELLCSFELLKPLESSQLKTHMKKGRNERQRMLNSPVCHDHYMRVEQELIYLQPASQYPQSY